MTNVIIRPATKEDLPAIIDMIQELADFEQMSEGPKLKIENLIRDGEFDCAEKSKNPLFVCYVAEIECEATSAADDGNNKPLTRKIIGYTISYLNYSTWQGKVYFLEDLYVRQEYRKSGAGRALFTNIGKLALGENCTRLDFHVLDWNPAKEFYKKMGATNITATESWQFHRMEVNDLKKLVNIN